jgi:hypothetical protein
MEGNVSDVCLYLRDERALYRDQGGAYLAHAQPERVVVSVWWSDKKENQVRHSTYPSSNPGSARKART